MTRSTIFTLIMIFSGQTGYSQIGGKRSFEFLNIPSTARLTGLGGVNVSLANEDVNLALANPALAGDSLTGHLSFNYLSYFADINAVSFVYQHDFGKWGTWFFGANHFDYGTIKSYDDTGAAIGEFDAGETVIFLGRSHRIRHFTLGGTLKYINSNIDAFSANALAIDLGGVFQHPTLNLSAGLVFKNIGLVLSDYSDGSNSKLPFDIQAGVSFKPGHMPFRFSFTGYNLYQGDTNYFNPNSSQKSKGTFDKVFRHMVIGTELLLTKAVNVRFGYNHLVRKELKLESSGGGSGFSYGLMFRIKAFEFSYSRGGYHAAGGSNNFTLTADINLFYRKRKM